MRVKDDGLEQAAFLDVVGEGAQLVIVEGRKERGDGVGFDAGFLVG
ncbi:hypothetical protein ACWCQ0_43270 [Streptomyces massasporeus]